METIQVIVLDYSSGTTHVYNLSMFEGWQSEDVEELIHVRHKESDSYWMTFDGDVQEHQGTILQVKK